MIILGQYSPINTYVAWHFYEYPQHMYSFMEKWINYPRIITKYSILTGPLACVFNNPSLEQYSSALFQYPFTSIQYPYFVIFQVECKHKYSWKEDLALL